MKINNKSDIIILGCMGLIPILNQLSNSMEKNISLAIYMPFLLIIVSFILSKRKLTINRKLGSIVILLILSYTIAPIIGLTIFKYNGLKNILYIFLFILLIFTLVILTSIINKSNYRDYIKVILCGNSLVLLINILINIHELNFDNILWLVNGDRISRAYFGFIHPNTVAMYIFIEIILIYMFFWKLSQKKLLCMIFNSILILCLVATGSRTATIATVLLFLLESIGGVLEKINTYVKLAILGSLIIPALFVLIINFDFSSFMANSSGRDSAMISNIKVIIERGNLLIGIAPINVSNLNTISGLMYSDNWYITHIIQFGIIGLLLSLSAVFILVLNFIKDSNKFLLNLIVTLLFYSSAENVLFVPGVLLSVILWSIFFINIKIRRE